MKKNTKEAIVTAAISLFNTQGYSGTSIRDIAAKAKVNSSNIAYYFENKHGLLEYCFTVFFEQYLTVIENCCRQLEAGAALCLKQITKNLMYFQCANTHMTRFIIREMSLDSQVVREIMSTYFIKEKYYFQMIIEEGISRKEFHTQSVPFVIIQLKGMLAMPFLNPHYISEVLHVFTHERYFAEKYIEQINLWIDGVLCKSIPKERVPVLS